MKKLSQFLLLAALCCTNLVSYGQTTTFVWPTITEGLLAGGVTSVSAVNCDMIDAYEVFSSSQGINNLWAIAYGGEKLFAVPVTTGLHVGIHDMSGVKSYSTLNIPIPYPGSPSLYAYTPDVVTGNYKDAGGVVHYFVAAVYWGDLGDVFLDAHEITFSTSYPYSIAFTPIVTGKMISNGIPADHDPHIDLCADPAGFKAGINAPHMHKFAACFNDGMKTYIVDGDIATITSGTTITPLIVSNTQGGASDIACVTDPKTGIQRAYVVTHGSFGASPESVYEWNLTTGLPTTGAYPYSLSFPLSLFRQCRIDASTLYDYSDNNAGTLWHAVDVQQKSYAGGYANGITHMILGNYASTCGTNFYSSGFDAFDPGPSVFSCITCPPPSPLPTYWQNMSPAICGVGKLIGGSWGPGPESNFTVGYYAEGSNISGPYNSYVVDPYDNQFCTPGVGPPTPGLNVFGLNTLTLSTPFSAAMGVGTCTNTGYNLLTAWYTGDPTLGIPPSGEIRYKFGMPPGYVFKNGVTNVNNVTKLEYKVYPNPTTGILIVDGAKDAAYEIVSALGQSVINGQIETEKHIINTSTLPAGIYMMTLSKEGTVQKSKLIKE